MADLTYTNRDYAAIRQAMLSDAPTKSPEWTNFNTGELGVVLVELLAGALDVLSYSLDAAAVEAFLDTAVAREHVQMLLRTLGYEMTRRSAAEATVTFTLNAPQGVDITIPAGTIVATAGGMQFALRVDAVILTGASSVSAVVYQGYYRDEGPFYSDGSDEQLYQLAFTDVADNFLDVYVDGVLWTEEKKIFPYPTLVTDLYVATEDASGNTTVEFSRYRGNFPSGIGVTLEFKYVSTDGASGNIGAGLINQIVSTLSLPGGAVLTVTNPNQATGGAERETVGAAKVNGVRSLRTLERAVTVQDFVDLLMMQDGVESVSAVNHSGFVEIYVRPDAVGGVFPLFKVEAPALLALTQNTLGGSIGPSQSVYVAVTAVDALGHETNYTRIAASTGIPLNNPATITTPTDGLVTHKVSVQLSGAPTGAVSFNVYVGVDLTHLYQSATGILPAAIISSPYDITALPGPGTLAPQQNLAGLQNPLTGRSLYQDLFDYLEVRRLLCTSFELFGPVAYPVAFTVTVAAHNNYRRVDVQAAVLAAMQTYFAARPIGANFYRSDLESYLFATVPSVQNVTVNIPAIDITMAAYLYVTMSGTPTITVTGGIA